MHNIVFKVRIDIFVYNNNCHKWFNWLLWNVPTYASAFFFAEDSVSKDTILFIPVLIYDYANFCWKDCRYISIFALPLKGKSKFFRNFYASREIWFDLSPVFLWKYCLLITLLLNVLVNFFVIFIQGSI